MAPDGNGGTFIMRKPFYWCLYETNTKTNPDPSRLMMKDVDIMSVTWHVPNFEFEFEFELCTTLNLHISFCRCILSDGNEWHSKGHD